MKQLASATLVMVLMSLFAAPAQAQNIEEGLWTGAMTPPGGQPIPVTLVVEVLEGALTIVMSNPELGPMEFTDEALEGDELTFWWNPGVRVDCSLLRQGNGDFEGPCVDPRGTGGGEGSLTMSPPAEPPPSN